MTVEKVSGAAIIPAASTVAGGHRQFGIATIGENMNAAPRCGFEGA